jgi:hypothetical protein
LSSDQEAVRDAFGKFFTKECPTECMRDAEPLGFDERLWRQVADTIIAQHILGLPRPSYPGSKVLVSRKRDQAAA